MSNRTDLPLNAKDDADESIDNPTVNHDSVSKIKKSIALNDTTSSNEEAVSSDADDDNDNAIEAFFAPSNKAENHNGVSNSDFKTGYVAIVGRPNVGKSTLMNHMLGQKLSITSRKPQTTRHRIHGILSNDEMQAIFVDTPGIHRNEVRAINERMNKAAVSALVDVDLVLFVVDSDQWRDDDLLVLQKLGDTNLTVVLVINKADTLKDKGTLLPLIETFSDSFDFADIVPVSALKNQNLTRLQEVIASHCRWPSLFMIQNK